jgi:hypothetical protein
MVAAATEQRERKAKEQKVQQDLQNQPSAHTVKDAGELYLTKHSEYRKASGKIISGARKLKGQSETRRTLYGDAVKVLGDMPAVNVTRKDITSMVMAIIERGAKVQAGNVLRKLSAAYEYAIGLEKLPDIFSNPALLAKTGLRQAKVKLTCERGKRVLSEAELKKLLQQKQLTEQA